MHNLPTFAMLNFSVTSCKLHRSCGELSSKLGNTSTNEESDYLFSERSYQQRISIEPSW